MMPSSEDVLVASKLPTRQRAVLVELLGGSSEEQIAASLAISKHSVRTALKGIHRRFAVSSRYELCAKLLEYREPHPQWNRRPYVAPSVPSGDAPADEARPCIDEATAARLATMEWSLLNVLDGLLAGCSEKGIAAELEESPNTIHTRAKRLYKLLGVASRAQLFRLFTLEPTFLREPVQRTVDEQAAEASSSVVPQGSNDKASA